MKTKKTILITMLISATLLFISSIHVEALSGSFSYIDHKDNGSSYQGTTSDNRFIYIACGGDGLRIYNKTSGLLLVTDYAFGQYVDVSVSGEWIAIANSGAGILFYRFVYVDDLNYALTANDSKYDGVIEDYYTVSMNLPAGDTVFCGLGGEGIVAYTWDWVTGALTLMGSQIDDDGGANYQGITSDGANEVWVACGTDGLRAYYWDAISTFTLNDTLVGACYNDVVYAFDGYLYCAVGASGLEVVDYNPGTATLTLVDTRYDGLGAGYLNVWSNDTLVYFNCFTEGIRAYAHWNGVTTQYLASVAPSATCTDISGDQDYVYLTAFHAGFYTYSFILSGGGGLITAPTISTNASSGITNITATLNGFVNDDGGEDCTVRFQYGLTPGYGQTTINQTKGTGESFLQIITGLTPNTHYHYRAVGNNSNTTDYGIDMTFTTLTTPLTVNWTTIFDGIGRMFSGGTYTDPGGVTHSVTGIFGGGFDTQAIMGLFIFIILFILTAMWGLGILIGSVAIIPSVFAVIGYIPELRIIVAIVVALIFGLGVNRFIRR